LPWAWESFPDYLDFLSTRRFDTDVCAQLPHAALRVFVMGDRGANREEATPEDIAAMAKLAKEAVISGAMGFSTSRTLNHRTSDGQPTPTLTASEAELTGIGMGLAEAGRGVRADHRLGERGGGGRRRRGRRSRRCAWCRTGTRRGAWRRRWLTASTDAAAPGPAKASGNSAPS
jgi:hypothetical protein